MNKHNPSWVYLCSSSGVGASFSRFGPLTFSEVFGPHHEINNSEERPLKVNKENILTHPSLLLKVNSLAISALLDKYQKNLQPNKQTT